MIIPIRQPDGASLCGQACIAMAAGLTLRAATEAVGHARRRGTETAELVAALDRIGVPCARKLRRVRRVAGRPVLPARCIVLIRRDGVRHCWHWMYFHDGVMYDPDSLWPDFYASEWRITSALEIYPVLQLRAA